MTRTEFIPIAETIFMIEVSLVVLMLVSAYLFKGYFVIKRLVRKRTKENWTAFWHEAERDTSLLTDDKIKNMQKRIVWVLMLMKQSKEKIQSESLFYNKIRKEVLLPTGKKLIRKHNYLKKYYAIECFYYQFDPKDEHYLLKAISHPVLLVSLNAARVSFKHGSTKLLEKVISHLAHWKWFQQDAIASMILEERPMLTEALLNCLEKEKSHSVRTLCYRLLLLLPSKDEVIRELEADLYSNFIDLRVVALDYLIKVKDISRLRNFMYDDDWVIRARTAHALGLLLDKESIHLLEEALFDPEWWVRTYSAEALLCFGQIGLAILQQQSPKPYSGAYDAAREALSRHRHTQIRKRRRHKP